MASDASRLRELFRQAVTMTASATLVLSLIHI